MHQGIPFGLLDPTGSTKRLFPGRSSPGANLLTADDRARRRLQRSQKPKPTSGSTAKPSTCPRSHTCSGSESGCFEQVSQSGTGELPVPQDRNGEGGQGNRFAQPKGPTKASSNSKREKEACDELVEAEGWAVEISTDIEMAHAVCQNCKILLVEAERTLLRGPRSGRGDGRETRRHRDIQLVGRTSGRLQRPGLQPPRHRHHGSRRRRRLPQLDRGRSGRKAKEEGKEPATSPAPTTPPAHRTSSPSAAPS